jgi:hypothetical protein
VHPDSDVIYSPVAWERLENGQLIRTETPIPEPRDPWILLAGWLLPQTGGPLWRKSKLLTIDGWKVGQPCCQEHELYGRLLEAGARFQYCHGCYAVYRDLEQDARVTRKSKGEFVRQKLAILDRLEDALRKSSQITPARRQAVNDARHQMARNLWSVNRHDAKITYRRILLSDPLFQPSLGASSPLVYLLIYKLLGFQGAEVLASLRRALNPWRVAGSYRKRCSI